MTRRWTRKITYEGVADDWVVLRDGLVVGRVMRDPDESSRLNREQWSWAVITMPAKSDWSGSMQAALEKVRELASDDLGASAAWVARRNVASSEKVDNELFALIPLPWLRLSSVAAVCQRTRS